jgi:hypothetical protein
MVRTADSSVSTFMMSWKKDVLAETVYLVVRRSTH